MPRVEQESLQVLGLAVQHLLQKAVGDLGLVARGRRAVDIAPDFEV